MNTNELTEVFDSLALNYKQAVIGGGADHAATYQDGRFRIVHTIKTEGGYRHHHIAVSMASVSRPGMCVSVNNKILNGYASRIIPDFNEMTPVSTKCTDTASHGWWRKAVEQ